MSYDDFLTDSCLIQTRTLGTGKVKTESWASQPAPTRCRVLFQTLTSFHAEKTQHVTSVRARFTLPLSSVIAVRDRIRHKDRSYQVIHVNAPHDANGPHHQVAVCEATVGV